MEPIEKAFRNIQPGRMTRRQLLGGLAVAAASATLPLDAFALPSFKPTWVESLHLYGTGYATDGRLVHGRLCDAEGRVERHGDSPLVRRYRWRHAHDRPAGTGGRRGARDYEVRVHDRQLGPGSGTGRPDDAKSEPAVRHRQGLLVRGSGR